MLLWIFLAITVVCIAVAIIMKTKGFDFDYHFGVECAAVLIIAALVITVIIMTSIACHCNNTAESYVAAMEQRYESLTYQLENDMYDNDNEYGKKALYDQVQAWNEELASNKIMQDNFWIGIFYYHVYDQFDFIQLPGRGADGRVSKNGY